jgi:hypothetical protein
MLYSVIVTRVSMTIVRNGILIFGTHIHAFEILTTVGLKSDNLNLDCLILMEQFKCGDGLYSHYSNSSYA